MSTTITHEYTPRGAAKELFARRDPELLICGPSGTGKSRAGLEKLHTMALLTPEMRGLIVRKTRESLGTSALVTWRKQVAKEAINAGIVNFYGGSAEEPAQYRYRDNGSVVAIAGLDKASKVMSTEWDVVFVQEATELTKDDWESLTTRLRNGRTSFQQLIADCNPDAPTHWLKKRCDEGTTVLLESRHEDNPLYFDDDGNMTPAGIDYIRGKLDKLTGVRYLRLRKGIWAAAEGMIFEDWDPAIHLIDRFEIPEAWPRYWVVDFGFTHSFVLQRWAIDPDGRAYLYAEQHMTRMLVEDHAAETLRLVTDEQGHWTEPHPRSVICDHDAEDRATLERHLGLSTIPAVKGVADGIQAVGARLKRAGDGKPRLFVLRDSLARRDPELVSAGKPTWLAEEISGYVWAEPRATGTVVSAKERPHKVDDDACDCCRYLCAELDGGVRPRVRWL
jgi:phage terminase large subunit